MATCNWPVGNGQTVTFTIYPKNTQWNKVAGLYIFAYANGNSWYALYVGQTDDFSSRLPAHERWDEAVRRGATHIHAMTEGEAAKRNTFERLLIQNLQPGMNEQFR